MTISHPPPEHRTPPHRFVEHVKQALEHLYDLPFLQSHPLLPARAAEAPGAGGQRLRKEIIAAIEALSPAPGTPFHAPHARVFNMLQLHYVEGITVQEAANELGISLRQAYRDLRHGEESVAAALWERTLAALPDEPRAFELSSIQAEVERLGTRPQSIDLHMLLQRAHNAVERLALQQGVAIRVESRPGTCIIAAAPALAQQVLVNLLRHAVQHVHGGVVHIAPDTDGARAALVLRYAAAPSTATAVLSDVAMQLLERLGWALYVEDRPDGIRTVRLQLAAPGPTILVVDDNESLVELLERYLSGHACRVVAATNGREGIRLAQELLPDAILLDVMMPEVDGWEVLQALRTHSQTEAIPIVVCSVFNDPDLAYSVGASLVLPKPIRREDVLSALHQLGVV